MVEAQGDVAILSGLGVDEVKMFNLVHPGDTLSVEAWWTDLNRLRSKPDRGFAGIRCKVTNQRKETKIRLTKFIIQDEQPFNFLKIKISRLICKHI